jgi:hypothetical protein
LKECTASFFRIEITEFKKVANCVEAEWGEGMEEMNYREEWPWMGKQRMLLQTEFNLLLKRYFVQIVLCKDMLNGVSLSTVISYLFAQRLTCLLLEARLGVRGRQE